LIRYFQNYYFQNEIKLLREYKYFKTLTKVFERLLFIIKQEKSKSISELHKIAEMLSKENWKDK